MPGKDERLRDDWALVLNTWAPPGDLALPPPGSVSDQDVWLWLDHVGMVCPGGTGGEIAETMLDFMAFVVQNPGVKVNWAPLLWGEQGTGKDTLFAPLVRAVGEKNTQIVTPDRMKTGFNDWVEGQLLVVEEVAAFGRVEFYNSLKPIVAAPPDRLVVNRKFMQPYSIPNVATCVFMTNHETALPLEDGDRRFWVVASAAPVQDGAYFEMLWTWFEGGGLVKCIRWLTDRAVGGAGGNGVSKFSPKTCPPDTLGFKRAMTIAGATTGVRWVAELFGPGGAFYGRTVVAPKEIERHAAGVKQGGISAAVVVDGLRALGGRRLNDGKTLRVGGGAVVRLWGTSADTVRALAGKSAGELAEIYDRETGAL
jgi:hypothetical protein